MANVIRQIIVINLETEFPIGRLVAHACHASVSVLLNRGYWVNNRFSINTDGSPELEYWMKESFTKVVCKTWGKDSILALKEKAESLGLLTGLIEEEGYITALAIGPGDIEKLNKFKDLPLL